MTVKIIWRTITSIAFTSYSSHSRTTSSHPIISQEVLTEMLGHSIEFCETLRIHLHRLNETALLSLGNFHYIIQNLDVTELLTFFATRSTKITTITFSKQPTSDIMKHFFTNNSIKRLIIERSSNFWTDIQTDQIEHLFLSFYDPPIEIMESFEEV